jgi:hypothetical protein
MPPGQRPTPIAIKLLAGNPGHRSINANEPKFTDQVPKRPLRSFIALASGLQ